MCVCVCDATRLIMATCEDLFHSLANYKQDMVVIFMSRRYEIEESTQTNVTLVNAIYKLSASFQKNS